MSILSGFFKTKKYRKTPNGYKLQSLWTSSETVEMGDGNTVETNLGAIQGITSSLATENDNYALSATAGKNLQDQITTVNTDLANHNFADVSVTVEFNGYWATVTNEQLGVDDAAQYVWSLIPVMNWYFMPFIYTVTSGGLGLRCWYLDDTTNSTVSLYQSGTLNIQFKGIRVK